MREEKKLLFTVIRQFLISLNFCSVVMFKVHFMPSACMFLVRYFKKLKVDIQTVVGFWIRIKVWVMNHICVFHHEHF